MWHRKALNKSRKSEDGNVLFLILGAIALFSALSWALTQSTRQQSNMIDTESNQLEASQILMHANIMRSVVHKVVADGTHITNIDYVLPTEAGYDTAPHTAKLFHPYGGGLSYAASAGTVTNLVVNNQVLITGVGRTISADTLLVGEVPSLSLCATINEKLYGTTAVPEVDLTSLQDMLAGNAATLEDGSTCSANECDELPHQCVQDDASTPLYVYYHTLYAR